MSDELTSVVQPEAPVQYFLRSVRRRGKGNSYKMIYRSRNPELWVYEFWSESTPEKPFKASGQYSWRNRHRRKAKLKPITEQDAMLLMI
jgi:hypothetical protein